MSTTVLATSHGLRVEETTQFFESLNATGFNGEMGLISRDINFHGKPNLLEWYPSPTYFRSSHRLFLYLEYMHKAPKTDKIILTGVRDVIFQANPEEIECEGLHIFQEEETTKIKDCAFNSRWITETYGEAGLERIGEHPIICAEIVIGTWDAMIEFLHIMTKHAREQEPKNILEDQAILNWLYWTGKLPTVTKYHNEEYPVYTMGNLKRVLLRQHRIFNSKGEIPIILHQYDRHLMVL